MAQPPPPQAPRRAAEGRGCPPPYRPRFKRAGEPRRPQALRRGPRSPLFPAAPRGSSPLSSRAPAGRAGQGRAARRRRVRLRAARRPEAGGEGQGPSEAKGRAGGGLPSGGALRGRRREADSSPSPASAPRSLRPPAPCSPRWPRGRRSHRPSAARPALRRWSGCRRCPWPLATGEGERRPGQTWRRRAP